jgi:hypothetical protein
MELTSKISVPYTFTWLVMHMEINLTFLAPNISYWTILLIENSTCLIK